MEDDVVCGLGNSLTVRPNPLKVIKHRSRKSEFFVKYDIHSSQPIGVGTYSICMKCRNRETNELVAVKIVTSHCDVTDEVTALKLCQGPFVVKLIEVLADDVYTFIVMDLLEGGDLLQRAERAKLTENDLALVFGQVVRAVRHMHSLNVVHRDLKPENICFVSNDGPQIRIIDFGFAQCLNHPNGTMSKSCYTLDYAAPEVLSLFNGQTYTKACDLWSIGVLIYTMMCGHSPFRNGLANLTHTQSINVIADRIRRGSFDFESSHWLKLTNPTKKLIKGLLHINPSERYSLDDIVQNDAHNHLKSEKFSNWAEPVTVIRCDLNLVFQAQRETFRNTSQPELIKKSISTTSIASSRHSSSNGGVLSRSSGHASYDQNNRSTSTATIASDTTELFNNNDKFDTTTNVHKSNMEPSQNNNLDHVKRLSVPQSAVPMEDEEDFYGFSTEDQNGVSEYVHKFKCVLQRLATDGTKMKQSPISPAKKRRSNIQIRHNYLKISSQCHQASDSPQSPLDFNDRNVQKRVANKTDAVDPVDPYFQRAIASGYVYGDFFNTSGLPAKRNRTNVNYKEIDDDVDIKKRRIRAFMKGTTNA